MRQLDAVAGGVRLETARRGASLHVDISSAPDCHADGPGSLQSPGAATVQDAMSLRLALKCLQVSLWDDERRIILGLPARGTSDSMPHEQEAFCLTLDRLVVSATHTPSQGQPPSERLSENETELDVEHHEHHTICRRVDTCSLMLCYEMPDTVPE